MLTEKFARLWRTRREAATIAAEPHSGQLLNRHKRQNAAFILILTVAYLALELPFAAHLLDIVGSSSDPKLIHQTEIVGRTISGLALSLLVFGAVILPRSRGTSQRDTDSSGYRPAWSRTRLFTVSLFATLLLTSAVYVGQAMLVERLVHSAGPEQRQAAYAVLTFTRQVQHDHADIEGLPLTPALLSRPEGKAFIATIPAIGSAQPDVVQRLMPAGTALARNAAIQQLGSPSSFYNLAYQQAMMTMADGYSAHILNVQERNRALNDVDQKAEQGWRDYRSEVKSKPHPVFLPAIRRAVRRNGVQVPSDWDGWNKAVFIRAATESRHAKIEQDYESNSYQIAQMRLPPELTGFNAFLAHPAMQRRWRDEIGLPQEYRLLPDQNEVQFTSAVYDPLIRSMAQAYIDRIEGELDQFLAGGRYYEDGVNAVRAMVVPPVALAFSLVGAFTHIIKGLIALLVLIKPAAPPHIKWAVTATALLATTFAPFAVPNGITRESEFQRLSSTAEDSMGRLAPKVIRWTVHSQPILYPVNDWVRSWTARLGEPYNSFWVHWIALLDPPPQPAGQGQTVAEDQRQPSTPGATTLSGRLAAEDAIRRGVDARPFVADALRGAWEIRANTCPSIMRLDAHRGDHNQIENSLNAVIASFAAGFDAVEIDVQRLRDGHWVLHHDETLGRVVTGTGHVGAMTRQQWLSERLRARNGRTTDISPSLLEDVLVASRDYLKRGQKLHIEIKGIYGCPSIESLVGTLRHNGVTDDQVSLASAHDAALDCLNGVWQGYKGLVVLDPRADKTGRLTQDESDRLLQRQVAMTETRSLREHRQRFGAPFGIHISSHMLNDDPEILNRTNATDTALMVYNLNGKDIESAFAILTGYRRTRRLPDGAIIDGDLHAFCLDLIYR